MSGINDVTIICKTHEREAVCNRLIASVRAMYPGVTIIVGDDSKSRPNIVGADRVEFFDYDIGLSAGRNRLVDLVQTKYTLVIDDDCVFYHATRLEDMIAILDDSDFNVVGGNMGWETMHGCVVKEGDTLHLLKGAFRSEDARGRRQYDFCHNFFMARTEVLREVRWPEEVKIYSEHVHYFYQGMGKLKVTKCNVSVKHRHERSAPVGPIGYERMRRRVEFGKISDLALGVTKRKITFTDKHVKELFPTNRAEPAKGRRLLPLKQFASVFSPLQGKRIGFIPNQGNVGDHWLTASAMQLFKAFDVEAVIYTGKEKVDALAYGGGGSMGGEYYWTYEARMKALATGLPVTILPQTFLAPEDEPYAKVFVRDLDSLLFAPKTASLAPDLALGFEWANQQEALYRRGVFLRQDRESVVPGVRASKGDPAKLVKTWQEYLSLAARYEWIVTDRLHFAIAGLLCERRVTLLANNYHKNRSMYDTWLKDLGCEWAEAVPAEALP